MVMKSIGLFLLPVENDDQKREIYAIVDNDILETSIKDSFMRLSTHLETAKEKFYTVRSNDGSFTSHERLSQLINEAVRNWYEEYARTTCGVVMLDPEAVFEIRVVGEHTFTFEYSPGIQKVLDRDRSAYRIREREFTPTDDVVNAISLANKILLKKSNFPIHRFKD